MLAIIAFAIGTTYLLRSQQNKYVWVTAIPLCFVTVTTLSSALMNIFDNYLPKGLYALSAISGILVILVCLVLIESFVNWRRITRMSNEELTSVEIGLIGEPVVSYSNIKSGKPSKE